MNDLENLLQDQIDVYTPNSNTSSTVRINNIQKADANASIFDFIKMISKLVSIVLKDLQVEFIPDEGRAVKFDPETKIDHPFITYKIISRTPANELKPRRREGFTEKLDLNSKRFGEVYGQKFKTIIQFNIFASVYETVEAVMERFEDLMFLYTGYFKKNGVSELLFRQQLTDSYFDNFRETGSVRNIQYDVDTEKLILQFKDEIKQIENLMKN